MPAPRSPNASATIRIDAVNRWATKLTPMTAPSPKPLTSIPVNESGRANTSVEKTGVRVFTGSAAMDTTATTTSMKTKVESDRTTLRLSNNRARPDRAKFCGLGFTTNSATTTARKETELSVKAHVNPSPATTNAPAKGPTALARLKVDAFSAIPTAMSSSSTSEGSSAWVAGTERACPRPMPRAHPTRMGTVTCPRRDSTARIAANMAELPWATNRIRLRSYRSAADPAQGARSTGPRN